MTARGVAVLREAWASAVSQPVVSGVTVLVVVGMVLAVMLTTGRSVGAEQRVLGSIDDAGTRTIEVLAEKGAGLTSDVLDRIESIEGVEWSAAFSAAVDATNAEIPDGSRVPVRLAFGTQLNTLGIPGASRSLGTVVYASPVALELLGLPDVVGSVTTTTGANYSLAGTIAMPAFLAGFEPLVLSPQPDATGNEEVSVLVVTAERPDLVAPVTDAVLSVLAINDPTKISVKTSETLAELRAIVQDQLGSFSRGLVLVTLAVTGLLVAVILYSLVMMRRKDFGRRRALGATRGLIVGLLLTQTVMLAALGVAVGLAASYISLALSADPVPGAAFSVALGVLTVATAAVAALVPAAVASTREPIRELRVP